MTTIADFDTYLKDYDCHLMAEETSHDELVALDADLPSDTHLVRYELGGQEYVAAIRCFKKADIFDALFDHGAKVLEITSGYGRIKPKLFGYQAKESSKKEKG